MSIQFIDDVFKVKQYCYHKEEEMCQCLCFCRFIMIHPHLFMVGLVAALVTRHRPCLGASDPGSAELSSTGLPLGQTMSSHRSCTWGMSLLHLAIAMQLEHLKKKYAVPLTSMLKRGRNSMEFSWPTFKYLKVETIVKPQ